MTTRFPFPKGLAFSTISPTANFVLCPQVYAKLRLWSTIIRVNFLSRQFVVQDNDVSVRCQKFLILPRGMNSLNAIRGTQPRNNKCTVSKWDSPDIQQSMSNIAQKQASSLPLTNVTIPCFYQFHVCINYKVGRVCSLLKDTFFWPLRRE